MSHKILLLGPSGGRRYEISENIIRNPSRKHAVSFMPSKEPGGPNFNVCIFAAIGAAQRGLFDRAAMIHDDVGILEGETDDVRCLDVLSEEMDRTGANFISTMIAVKEFTGRLSCGIGDPADQNQPWRRWCQSDQPHLPPTFSAHDVGYGDKYLCHNMGLCMWDLTAPAWHLRDKDGRFKIEFNFKERIYGDGAGKTHVYHVSEDFHYSRLMWQYGATSVITQKLVIRHVHDFIPFDSHGRGCTGVGAWTKGDEELAHKWRATDPLKKQDRNGSGSSKILVGKA